MDDFWSSIEEVAGVPASSVMQVGQVLDLYLDLVGEAWPFLTEDEPFVAARLLLNCKALNLNVNFTRQRLLSCLDQASKKSDHWTCFLAVVLGVEDQVLSILTTQNIHSILHLIYMFRFDNRCVGLLFQLLYVAILRQPLDLEPFDAKFCKMVLQLVCDSEDQDVSGAGILVLAALNHRFAQAAADAGNDPGSSANLALEAMYHAPHRFGECLVWLFNRSTSPLLCKLLYQVLVSVDELFYFNDLKVLIDILLRELIDMSRDHEQTRELYLMVLLKVLQAPALEAEPYKRSQLVRTLRSNYEGTQNAHMTALIDECLAVKWLEWNCLSHESPHQSRETVALTQDVEQVASPFTDANPLSPRLQTPDTMSPGSPSTPIASPPGPFGTPGWRSRTRSLSAASSGPAISPIGSPSPEGSPVGSPMGSPERSPFTSGSRDQSPYETPFGSPIASSRSAIPTQGACSRARPAPPPPRRVRPPPPPPRR